MSNNLDIFQLGPSQSNKEVGVNTATGGLDAAITEIASVDVSAGNVNMSAGTYRSARRFDIEGAATSGRTVTLPAVKREALFIASAGNSDPVQLIKGSTTYDIDPGTAVIVYTDGTTDGMVVIEMAASIGGSTPWDIGFFAGGVPANAELLFQFVFVRDVDLPSGLTGSAGYCVTTATAAAALTMKKNGSSIGSVDFAIGSNTATFTFASPVSFAAGDRLTIENQGTADATLADISVTLKGSRP